MNPRVLSVVPRDDFRLEITFANKKKGLYDCRRLLKFGVFRELSDLSYFRQARVVAGTVVWPHEQDICPDTFYTDSKMLRLS
ncbi:MAG: DUF2442 domain-containing protein [Elusimicrobiota bacterium]|nr:DUF2442 domain-containing protein [Elusimicrobiota bacterium]